MNILLISSLIALAIGGKGKKSNDKGNGNSDSVCTSTDMVNITAIIYADNWFRFYFNGVLIAEDPVIFIPHQAVEVTFEAPICGDYTFAIQAQDFSDDITGLEYDDNCVGDGGLKAQFSDGTVTNGEWKCKTIMWGPLDAEDCIPNYDPDNYHFVPTLCKYNTDETLKGRTCRSEYYSYSTEWIDSSFNDKRDGKGWVKATTFTDDVVGYGVRPSNCTEVLCPEDLDWAEYGDEAEFIWGPDLNFDNRVLCRYTYFREEAP